MDFEKIGELPSPGEKAAFYYSPQEHPRVTKEEFTKAKAFLSTVSGLSNVSMYDHLTKLIERVLRHKVENAVDIIEDISRSLKAENFQTVDEFLEIPEVDKRVLEYISTISNLFEGIKGLKTDINPSIRDPDLDEEVLEDEGVDNAQEEEEQTEETESWSPAFLHDVCHHMFRFRQCGVGLGSEETFQLNLSLKALAVRFKLDNIRFWGKILGTTRSYYIAEAPYTEGIPTEDYGNKLEAEVEIMEPQKTEEEDEGNQDESMDADSLQEGEKGDEEEVKDEDNGEHEGPAVDSEKVETEETMEIPPIPVPQPPPSSPVLAEENGKGVNKYMYFVTNSPTSEWHCLPQLTPDDIVHARQLKRFFTGKLDAEIRRPSQFQGAEAHYLRAQIARISASTILSPSGYYRIKKKEVENGADEAEKVESQEQQDGEMEDESSNIEENPEYKTSSVKELFGEGLNGWIHYRQGISPQGCCSWKYLKKQESEEKIENIEDEQGEHKDEEEVVEDEEEEKIDKNPIPRLRAISEDRGAGGIVPWSLKLSSTFVGECAVILARSNIWPGAFTYYDSSNFESMYIGYGYKYTVQHYAPMLEQKWQQEYEVGSDVIEPVDFSPVASEEEEKPDEGENEAAPGET